MQWQKRARIGVKAITFLLKHISHMQKSVASAQVKFFIEKISIIPVRALLILGEKGSSLTFLNPSKALNALVTDLNTMLTFRIFYI